MPYGKMMIPGHTERPSQRRNGRFAWPRKRWTNIEKNTAAETQQSSKTLCSGVLSKDLPRFLTSAHLLQHRSRLVRSRNHQTAFIRIEFDHKALRRSGNRRSVPVPQIRVRVSTWRWEPMFEPEPNRRWV